MNKISFKKLVVILILVSSIFYFGWPFYSKLAPCDAVLLKGTTSYSSEQEEYLTINQSNIIALTSIVSESKEKYFLIWTGRMTVWTNEKNLLFGEETCQNGLLASFNENVRWLNTQK